MRQITIAKPLLISLTVDAAMRLKAKGLLDVMRLTESMEQLAAIFEEPGRFAQVLFELLDAREQLTFEQFAASLTESVPTELWEAFTDEVTDFFPDNEQRMLASLVLERVADAHRQMIRTQLQLLEEMSGRLYGNSQELPESIPDVLPYDNSMTWSMVASETTGPLPVVSCP